MAKQVLNNGETGSVIRGKINDNFTEIYNFDTDNITEGTTNKYLTGNEFQKNTDTMDDIPEGSIYVKTTNDYTDTEKTKLSGIEEGAEVNTVDSDTTGVSGADQITNIISLTQAEYDAIGTPDSATLYVITS